MELRKKGAARVLITDGSRIAADSSRDATILAKPPAVEIAHISGAGDSFVAAHVAAEAKGANRAAALKSALREASNHVSGEVSI